MPPPEPVGGSGPSEAAVRGPDQAPPPTPPTQLPPGMTTHRPDNPPERFEPAAAALAILFPGAGQMFLGEFRRGLMVMVGVLGLFFGGMLIGGIDVVDKEEDFVWFLGQSLVGPVAFGTDWVHQNWVKVVNDTQTGRRRTARPEAKDEAGNIIQRAEVRGPGGLATPAEPGQLPPNTKSLGRMNEIGTLYGAIAGMLNLIAILDALFHNRVVGSGVGAKRPAPKPALSATAGGPTS
jgi:hypothetical protein